MRSQPWLDTRRNADFSASSRFDSPRLVLIAAALAALLACLSACSGLSAEPRIVSTSALPTITPTAPPDIGHPVSRVSIAHGAAIFAGSQSCAACHGDSGRGDGQVAASFACPLPDFTDVAMARSQTISAWFAITSNGNGGATDCLMPPWKGRLDEQERWDVTSYLYSLHYTPGQLARGQTLWAENCAACHGQTGKGDGPQAKASTQPVPDFTDPAYLIGTSDTDLWNSVTNGRGTTMPAFKDTLSDDDRWTVVAYARSLTWESTASTVAVTEQATTTSAPDTPTVKVTGKIALGTPGASFPANQLLTLRIIDPGGSTPRDLQTFQTTAALDGSFSFGDVPRRLNMVYLAATAYAGQTQNSAPVLMAPGMGASVDLSFKVYEVTSDSSVIQVEGDQLYFVPFNANTVLVQEAMSFHNTGDRLFTNGPDSIEVTLPSGAQQITLDPGMAHQFAVGGDSVIRGLGPVYPGESNAQPLQFSYLLPFNTRLVMSRPTAYLVQSLALYIPQTSGLVPSDAPFIAHQAVQLQDGVYNVYFLKGSISAGTSLQFSLQSQGDQAAQGQTVLTVVLILAVLVSLATGVAIWLLNRQSRWKPVRLEGRADRIIDSVADLDLRFEKGKITREEYESERARLLERVTRLFK